MKIERHGDLNPTQKKAIFANVAFDAFCDVVNDNGSEGIKVMIEDSESGSFKTVSVESLERDKFITFEIGPRGGMKVVYAA